MHIYIGIGKISDAQKLKLKHASYFHVQKKHCLNIFV